MPVKILCIGDVVGKPGRAVLADHLPDLIKERGIDFVVCNGENAAGGSGITPQIFSKMGRYGVDVVTLGDHVYKKIDITRVFEVSDRIVRPANISVHAAGRRWTMLNTRGGQKVAVVCLLGQLYMGSNDSPWACIDRVMAEIPASVKIRVVDFHAEATSEKIAMGWYLAGRASIVFGTHTHVPTADCTILNNHTAYITDVGMTGPYDSVLGRCKEKVLSSLTTSMPTRYDIATGDPRICGMLATIDETTGKALEVERIEVRGRKICDSAYDDDDGKPSYNNG